MFEWEMAEMIGYTPITTFWSDFSIADMFGVPAIMDTYIRAFKEWRGDYKYLTELVMVLNHKIFLWHEQNHAIALMYDKLWQEADNYALKNLKGEELQYFLNTTD